MAELDMTGEAWYSWLDMTGEAWHGWARNANLGSLPVLLGADGSCRRIPRAPNAVASGRVAPNKPNFAILGPKMGVRVGNKANIRVGRPGLGMLKAASMMVYWRVLHERAVVYIGIGP